MQEPTTPANMKNAPSSIKQDPPSAMRKDPPSAMRKDPPSAMRKNPPSAIKRDFIEWSDALSIGVQEVDEQHKRLAHMVNELSEGIGGGWGKEARDRVLVELIEYTRVHFATEESLMSISSYPNIKKHKKQHEDLIAAVKAHVKKYDEDPNTSSYDLLFFLKKWLVNHIMGEDKQMGMYLVKRGFGHSEEKKSLLGKLKSLFGFGS